MGFETILYISDKVFKVDNPTVSKREQTVEKLFQKAHQQVRMKFLLFMMEYERLREETATDTNEGEITTSRKPKRRQRGPLRGKVVVPILAV